VTTSHTASQSGRRRGCFSCCGCLAALGVLAVLLVLGAVFTPTLLRAAGLRGPGAEELYAGAPDPVATEALNDVLVTHGIEGVNVWVIPIQGSEGQIAILTFDENATAGGIDSRESAEAFMLETLQGLANANRSGELGIEYVAMDYQDESGGSLISWAAPQTAVDAYANGQITRRQFLAQVEVDFSNIISAAELRRLLEEAE
jgi:hypothetical protein